MIDLYGRRNRGEELGLSEVVKHLLSSFGDRFALSPAPGPLVLHKLGSAGMAIWMLAFRWKSQNDMLSLRWQIGQKLTRLMSYVNMIGDACGGRGAVSMSDGPPDENLCPERI